jgi:transposase-like protein
MKAKLGTQKGQHIVDLSEDEAREHLEKLLWPNGAVCPHCNGREVYKMRGETCRAGLHRCRECDKQFTVTVGTIFEDSKIPLAKWIRAFHLMCSSKKGISALQLQRNLGLGSYRTAWHLAHRVRHAMQCEPLASKLSGTVQADETYVGGKRRGVGMKRAMDNKVGVVSLLQPDGDKRSFVMDEKVTAKNLSAVIRENVQAGVKLHTDESPLYKAVGKEYQHQTVRHYTLEYVRRDTDGSKITTNTVESSFALLKRGLVGAFHHVSKKHLHRYCNEFDFRWNARKVKDVERTEKALGQSKGKRLTLRPLTERSPSAEPSVDGLEIAD